MSRARRLQSWCADSTTLRRIHGWATVVWIALAIPSALVWKNSVPYLVAVSVYANFVGHFSSWQSARVEVKQDEIA